MDRSEEAVARSRKWMASAEGRQAGSPLKAEWREGAAGPAGMVRKPPGVALVRRRQVEEGRQ